MKGKKGTLSITVLSLAIMVFALPLMSVLVGGAQVAEAKSKPIVLKAVTFQRAGIGTTGFEIFMNKLNEAAKGELVIKWTGGPAAIPAHDQPEALRRGVVDFAFTPPGYYKSQLPEASATFFSRLTPWEERKIGYFDLLVDLHEKAGWRYIGNAAWGTMYHTWTTFKVKKPEDLAGHLIRSGRTSLAFCKALGIKPVTMPISDVYSGLDRGIIEGYMLGPSPTEDLKLYEVVKYAIKPGFYSNRSGFLMNLDSWNRLPKHLQELIKQTQIGVDRQIVDTYNEVLEKAWNGLVDRGIEVIEFSPDDAKRFADMAYESGWKAAAKNMDPKTVEKIEKMLFKK